MDRFRIIIAGLLVAIALGIAPSASHANSLTEVLVRAWFSGRELPGFLAQLRTASRVTEACGVCVADPVAGVMESVDQAAVQAVLQSERTYERERHASWREIDDTSDGFLARGFKAAPYEMRTSRWVVPVRELVLSRAALILDAEGEHAHWVTGTVLGSPDDWKTFYLLEEQTQEIVRFPIRGPGSAEVLLYLPQ